MRSLISSILRQECAVAWRTRGQCLTSLFFLVLIVSLFPLVLGTDEKLLTALAPGLLWISVFLAQLLVLPKLFYEDFKEGRLELIVMSNEPTLILSIKVIMHWFIHVVPLILLLPLFTVMFQLTWTVLVLLMMSLLLGTLILQFLGAMVSALVLGVPAGGLLLSLLVIPLFIPVIILGLSGVTGLALGLFITTPYALLGAMGLLALAVLPMVITAALRIGLQEC